MADRLAMLFALNRPVVVFAYGLVFFVLGLAIAMQSRRHSRLVLARRLTWLSAFGFLHALHEWGGLFVPIQATYLPLVATRGLVVLQLALLGASFACLMQFGVDLFRPLPGRWARVRWLALGVAGAWALSVTTWMASAAPSFDAWTRDAEILARLTLGFPASCLAAAGLWRRAEGLVVPLNDARTRRWLRTGAAALAGYAVATGLLAPRGGIWPSMLVNAEGIEAAFGVPVVVFRSVLGLVLVVAVIRTVDLFNVETDHRLDALEESRIVAAECERIARDLHDRTLQAVYAAGLTVSACYQQEHGAGRVEVAERLDETLHVLDHALDELRRHIKELHGAPLHVSFADGLRDALRQSALSSLADVDVHMDIPPSAEFRPRPARHALAIASEALSNVARHAHARRVELTARVDGDRFELAVVDDGRGFPRDFVAGYGVHNMHERAGLLHGTLDIQTEPGRGTRVTLRLPLAEMQR